jgi:perosamine synthetase
VSAGAGRPTIPIAKPVMGEAEVEAAARAIRSGWVTQGPEVAAFEREFAAYVGAPHAVAVSSATTALHLALLAAGVGPGDEVITVSHSFIATANVVRYCAATPVFVDVQPGTFNLDPALLAGALTPRTRAILCVHQMGMPCDVAAILDFARPRGLAVVEDAACAAGSELRRDGAWERIGRPHGDLACFSFHPRKLVATGDGGMVTTASAEWDARLRLLRQHGMSVPDTARHASARVIFEAYPLLGFNYRMTDIQAAVGREQLKRLPAVLERRRALARRYLDLLADVRGLRLPAEPAWARTNWQSFCVVLPEHLDQRETMQRLLDAGISTRRGIMNAHREAAYPPGTWRAGSPDLKESERAQDHGLLLPLFHELTPEDQDRVVGALRACCA